MTQQAAAAVGFPVLSPIAATQSVELTGVHLALNVDVAVTLAGCPPVAAVAPARRARAARPVLAGRP
jgi:hypothetical protein